MSNSGLTKHDHDRVVEFIARNRFPFPDQTDWPRDYRTLVNVPENKHPIHYRENAIFPDIVVVDGQGNVRETGDVELEILPTRMPRLQMISLMTPKIEDTDIRHFFLYVPDEVAEQALESLRKYRVSYAGLRSFRVEEGDIIITPVDTPGHSKDHRESR